MSDADDSIDIDRAELDERARAGNWTASAHHTAIALLDDLHATHSQVQKLMAEREELQRLVDARTYLAACDMEAYHEVKSQRDSALAELERVRAERDIAAEALGRAMTRSLAFETEAEQMRAVVEAATYVSHHYWLFHAEEVERGQERLHDAINAARAVGVLT